MAASRTQRRLAVRPEPPVERWLAPFARFLRIEAASGSLLLLCAVAALALANSPLAERWHALFETRLAIGVGPYTLDWTLHHWINDGLMTVFFFVVGLEIKREFALGELREPKQAALPIAAALGGMVVPAAIYLALRAGEPDERGWGIPMATDIAFVVGCMAVLGRRVPHGLKVLVLALAIVDDIGAILVIAVGYSDALDGGALAVAAAGFGACALANRIGVRQVAVYVWIGAGIWLALVRSGVHPTVAGVLLGLLTPASAFLPRAGLDTAVARAAARLGQDSLPDPGETQELALELAETVHESVSPLERLEARLHPWVAFAIMPLFALANAGVALDARAVGHPVGLAVAAGLVIGKPIGIALACFASVHLGLARLPTGVHWRHVIAGGCLGGIGFTMALFIAGLALEGELLDAAKVGILGGSTLAALLGAALLLPRPERAR
jgi:NhaA family Na+:H+ antiporter